MKGTGSSYGFDAISEIGASLQQFAKERNCEKVRTLAEEVTDYIESVDVVLRMNLGSFKELAV